MYVIPEFMADPFLSAFFNQLLWRQTITEKHKLNVPETMTEILDVSDDEGEPDGKFQRAAPWF